MSGDEATGRWKTFSIIILEKEPVELMRPSLKWKTRLQCFSAKILCSFSFFLCSLVFVLPPPRLRAGTTTNDSFSVKALMRVWKKENTHAGVPNYHLKNNLLHILGLHIIWHEVKSKHQNGNRCGASRSTMLLCYVCHQSSPPLPLYPLSQPKEKYEESS